MRILLSWPLSSARTVGGESLDTPLSTTIREIHHVIPIVPIRCAHKVCRTKLDHGVFAGGHCTDSGCVSLHRAIRGLRSDGDPLWRSHGQRLRVRQVGAQPNFLINTILDNTSPITIDDPVIRLTKNNLGTLARSSYPGFHVGHECRWRRFHGSDSSELAPRLQDEGGERT